MSDEIYSVVALVTLVASAIAVWSSIRRRQLERRVLQSLLSRPSASLPDEIERGPRTAVAELESVIRVLREAVEDFERTVELLQEADNVGLWNKSDDSSDNRRKRTLLREADWSLSSAERELAACRPEPFDVRETIVAFEAEVHALVLRLEPLAGLVTDTMGVNHSLDYTVSVMQTELRETAERLRHFASACSVRAAEERERATPSSARP
ncbi:MAG: hypothetical protein ABI779_11500 [Acidobacteriota bacterium]